MLNELRTFFDHSRHSLTVHGVEAPLDVLAFTGEEALSQTFAYRIEFTSISRDISAGEMLLKDASFNLRALPEQLGIPGYTPPVVAPLRTLHGVITGFKRLSGSRDEARYEVTLEPRLKLLARGCQYRIFQNQSVPEIVEQVLRHHGLRGQDFLFELTRDYPDREQVMQYGEDDLAFIQRLLAEVGIWYRFSMDARLKIDVVELHDDQRHYLPAPLLPLRPLAGLESTGQDAVWDLQASHRIVPQQVSNRAYYHREAGAQLDASADLIQSPATTYGDAYHYGEPHQKLGDAYAQDEDLQSESGYFYARLAHERYLNQRTRLTGRTSSPVLAPGQELKIDGAPQAFTPGAVIVRLYSSAARDRSYEVQFEAIPYAEHICFRPDVPAKPVIAGTIPARVTSPQQNDPCGHIDGEGRYRVNFLFDRNTWPAGRESMWLRLARPYAGDTYGLHLPLLAGTEVAIAFEQGDPDRPFIAHALHDNLHSDHVTIQNYKRNVLRTPANNKLRMDDTRGQEHIKLSTEYSGKSQLNLGHLVDAQKQKRGEGFELRTDGWGSVRAGKGVFISADVQPGAQGQVLAMQEAIARLQQASDEMQKLSADAETAKADPADVLAQLALMNEQVDQLEAAVLLLSAPQGIALTSGHHLQLAAQRNLILNAGHEADISVVKRLFIGVGEGLSLFVRKLGMKLIANQGAVSVQAQNDRMELLARKAVDIVSTENEVHFTAKKKIIINAGGSYIQIDQHGIEYGTQGDHLIKSAHFEHRGPAHLDAALQILPPISSGKYRGVLALIDQHKKPIPDRFYKVVSPSGLVLASGVTDESGKSIEVVSHEGPNATAYIGQGGWTISEVELSTDDECGCC
ncbi:type VI secretion system tip protein VgrG [Pseudomonas sp. LA21]|uniref:type VI secretion system Vgr family protein n=1 Tax=unclassified Pseudomonas TaxID=196821 RepID=UPI001FB6687C|nr:type VI secretion system tip protein VgrG [Pseudomonas sp. LA21]MCJ1883970.1 type VI secretion system tip protein VgrG [Pseudomonas sp. LA21]